jgi:hypothetical protein
VTELGRSDLSGEDREQLIRLRWLWEKSYDIDCDGVTWTARPHYDPGRVLSEPSSQKLWLAIKDDNAERKAATGRGGYWIETCSGPPYFVATPPAPRFRNSG